MPATAGRLVAMCAAAMLTAGCAQTIQGTALRAPAGIDDESRSPIDVESVMLDQAQMRAITGAGDSLTIVPSMDGKIPVDASDLMSGTPAECKWYFAETQTFGSDVEEFHKTTYQDPPDGGLISEGAAAYRDPPRSDLATLRIAATMECRVAGNVDMNRAILARRTHR